MICIEKQDRGFHEEVVASVVRRKARRNRGTAMPETASGWLFL